jgi:hypothetical protein
VDSLANNSTVPGAVAAGSGNLWPSAVGRRRWVVRPRTLLLMSRWGVPLSSDEVARKKTSLGLGAVQLMRKRAAKYSPTAEVNRDGRKEDAAPDFERR